MKFQNFSDNDLHFVFGLLTLALNNAVVIKYFNDSIMHLNQSLGYSILCCINFKFAIIFESGHHFYIILMGLQEGQVGLDKGQTKRLLWWGWVHLYFKYILIYL